MGALGSEWMARRARQSVANRDLWERLIVQTRRHDVLWHKVKGTQDCGSPMPYDRGNKKLDATELERLGLYIDSLK